MTRPYPVVLLPTLTMKTRFGCLFALIRNALKEYGIEIPYPHRVIELKGKLAKLAEA